MVKRNDPDFPVGKLKRIEDALPPPEQLVFGEKTTKVTIALSQSSVAFFKQQARRNHTKYQRMIREVLDRYAAQYGA